METIYSIWIILCHHYISCRRRDSVLSVPFMRKKNIREEIYEIKSVLRKIIDFKNRVLFRAFLQWKNLNFLNISFPRKKIHYRNQKIHILGLVIVHLRYNISFHNYFHAISYLALFYYHDEISIREFFPG